jgi:site-specific DNA-cytosine methylase
VNILSLFNGISGLHLACDRAGVEVDKAYYSEIDKYANQVTQKHYPDDIALGDVTKWSEWGMKRKLSEYCKKWVLLLLETHSKTNK